MAEESTGFGLSSALTPKEKNNTFTFAALAALGSKNLECSYCHRKLSSRQTLKEHESIHAGVKPYECLVPGCGARFRQGSHFSSHKKKHLKGELRKPEEYERIIGLLLPPITLVKAASAIPNIFTVIKSEVRR